MPYVDSPGLDLGLVAYGETGLWIGKQKWQDSELDFGFPTEQRREVARSSGHDGTILAAPSGPVKRPGH